MKLDRGKVYQISFMDPEQPENTRFTGQGVFLHEDTEDYDTGEQHYYFTIDGETEPVSFPQSSISIPLDA